MPNLKEVKNRIRSVMSTQQITKAMKMVAASKLRRAQDNILQMRPYAGRLNEMLQNLTAGSSDESTSFGEDRVVEKVLLIVITSDKGLCGAFNTNVHKIALSHISKNYDNLYKRGDLDILPIGRKGRDFFKKRNYNVIDDYWKTFSDLSFDNATKAAKFAMDKFQDKTYDKVEIIYNEFKNVATQILRVEQFLPVLPIESANDSDIDYIYQPDKQSIVSEMIPKSLKVQLYKAILESNASEQGARMTAMEQATDNAGELLKQLRLTYNRTRQAAITKEILEIVAGAEALGH
ncbi:MAG: ATP synthase F1 subunit gamma [Cyclobacteriaceae bacterium]|nr:ATP synthase F1 subunit gamma [Cyclobacteriaceae bacterium]